MKDKIKRIWPGWEIDDQKPDHGVLGSGSFGDVYRIWRCTHGILEYAALKVITIPRDARELNQLRQEYDSDEQLSSYYLDVKSSFENEYATMVLLKGHANIVYCDDIRFDEHPDGFGWDIHMKMELLTPMMKQLPAHCSEEDTRKLGIDICRALTLCQKLGIIHRDIKPQNIFLSRDGNFKLGDFGIAKQMDGTQLGTMAGTEDYMAPEVMFFQPYSSQADIYSLGLVMYWMLNDYAGPFLSPDGGKPTYAQKTAARTQRLKGAALPSPLRGSEALQKVILKACAFDQKKRYTSAEEMLQDLLTLDTLPDCVSVDEDKTVREVRKPSNPAAAQTAATPSSSSPTVREAAPKVEGTPSQHMREEREEKAAPVRNNAPGNSTPRNSEPYAKIPPRKDAVTPTPPRKAPSEPYSYTPPKKDAVTPTPPRKAPSEPYSYTPPKKDAVTSTPPRKAPSEPYSYVPPRQSRAQDSTEKPQPSGTQGNTQSQKVKQKPAAAVGVRKKKKKRSILLWMLLLVVLAAAAYGVWTNATVRLRNETVVETPGDDFYGLLEVGYIDDPDCSLFIHDYLRELYDDENGNYTWYNYKGEKLENFHFKHIYYLGNGLYEARSETQNINRLSLVSREGEILFFEEACIIEWDASQDEENPRYLKVYTADAETIDRTNGLISVKEGNVYASAQYGDTCYTGQVRLYDTIEKRFVPNLPTVTARGVLSSCGNSILIENQGVGSVLYNADGLPLAEIADKDPSVGNGYLIAYNGGTYHVYDENGNCTYVTNNSIYPVSKSEPYLEESGSGRILDLSGNVILEGYDVINYYDGMFEIRTKADQYALITPEGREITPCSYDSISQTCPGYYYARYGKQYTLLNSDGILATNLSSSPYKLGIEKENHLFVINRRSYDLDVQNRKYTMLTDGMAAVKSPNTGLYTVYDLFTGEALLPYEYEKVEYAAGYLYVYREGGWGIFSVNFFRP